MAKARLSMRVIIHRYDYAIVKLELVTMEYSHEVSILQVVQTTIEYVDLQMDNILQAHLS